MAKYAQARRRRCASRGAERPVVEVATTASAARSRLRLRCAASPTEVSALADADHRGHPAASERSSGGHSAPRDASVPVVSSLTTGPVTFLCVDVEGSTRLATRSRRAVGRRTRAHPVAVRDGIRRRAASSSTVGTSCSRPSRRPRRPRGGRGRPPPLADEPWPDGARVRVRAGLHTGLPMLATTATSASRCIARTGSRPPGTEDRSSSPSRRLTSSPLPVREARTLLRLRDLPQPERIFQLGEVGFPPLRDAVAARRA